jgi:hypothetical protein
VPKQLLFLNVGAASDQKNIREAVVLAMFDLWRFCERGPDSGYSGPDLLTLSSSRFDPERSSLTQAPARCKPEILAS